MGIYDSSKDKASEEDVKINSLSPLDSLATDTNLFDNLQKTLSLTNDLTLNTFGKLRGWGNDLLDSWDSFNDSRRIPLLSQPRVLHEPNQIVARGIPPPEIYEECGKAEGLSLWDQKGIWHCLFPRSKIPYDYGTGESRAFGINPDDAKQLISREDIENDVENKHGLFFKNLEDMLGWQASMKRAIAEKRRRQWSDWESKEKAKWGLWNKGTDDDNSKNYDDDGKTVVGRETETSMVTLDNGDLQRTTTQRRFYSDGTSKVWEKSEILAPDGTVKKSD